MHCLGFASLQMHESRLAYEFYLHFCCSTAVVCSPVQSLASVMQQSQHSQQLTAADVIGCFIICLVQAWTYAIEQSCLNKAAVVAADEREGGVRATLNLGHTFGHAIETGLGYGELPFKTSCIDTNVHPSTLDFRGRIVLHRKSKLKSLGTLKVHVHTGEKFQRSFRHV